MELRDAVIVRCAKGTSAHDWRTALAGMSGTHPATLIKEEDGDWVCAARLGAGAGQERMTIVKFRRFRSGTDQLRTTLGFGRFARHWRGARRLARAGVATATPLALGRAQSGSVAGEVLVLEYLPGRTLLELLAAVHKGEGPPVAEQHALAHQVGALVGRLARAWLVNRDLKPSNIIVMELSGEGASGATPQLAVIDCVGIRASMSGRAMVRMCQSLVIEPTGCGVPPRRTLMFRAMTACLKSDGAPEPVARGERWILWVGVAGRVRKHGDMRPRTNLL